ncbi:hypothetical protein MHK_003015, partial [Candidatus Magnetomorum sp. HK-1]
MNIKNYFDYLCMIIILLLFFCSCAISPDHHQIPKEHKIINAILKDQSDKQIVSRFNINKVKLDLFELEGRYECSEEQVLKCILEDSSNYYINHYCLTEKEVQAAEIFLTGHSGSVNSVCFSPDGKWIASASSDDTIKLWDAHNGWLHKILKGHSGSVNSVNFSPDGNKIVSGSYDNTIKLWDVHSGRLLDTFKG